MLQSRFGLRAEVADSIATERFVSGSAGLKAGFGGSLGLLSAGVSASGTGGIAKRWSDNDTASVSRERSSIEDALETWSASHGWSQNRDAFERSVSTSSRSDVSSSASGISASINEAQSFSKEARRFYEEADRLEARWSARDGEGVSGSLNTSDAFLSFAWSEIAHTPLVYSRFDPSNATHWHSGDPQIASERDLLISKYVQTVGEDMRAEIEERLAAPDANGLVRPGSSSSASVHANGVAAAEAVPALGGVARDGMLRDRTNNVGAEVLGAQDSGAEMIEQRRERRDAQSIGVAPGLTSDSAKRARQ
jgi:conjugal transfer mating pair stabilization protein TraG